ncbi:2483_t:CDS:2 [Diversispora eburnea]|uniref:2483_t:CDS:1 n=1 Tax=Diversispora eburnea TaxID=1213867 RepID=A0A9N9AC11_9GLOM|nr:2483_t:CDS:2 [Diversispora eburnea]
MRPSITIVTGASYNHFCPLHNWIYYMKSITSDFVVKPRIIIYDIGLRKYQYNALTAYQLNVSQDYPGELILWVDSGTLISSEFLENVPYWSDRFDGFVSPKTSGDVGLWTHPGVFEYFKDSRNKYVHESNCNGAVLLFDTDKTQHLIDAWYQCALIKACIAPKGSDRTNHRQDQSIITYLALRDNRKCNRGKSFFKITTHQENGCLENVLEYEKINGNVWTPSLDDLKEIKKFKSKNKVFDIWTK